MGFFGKIASDIKSKLCHDVILESEKKINLANDKAKESHALYEKCTDAIAKEIYYRNDVILKNHELMDKVALLSESLQGWTPVDKWCMDNGYIPVNKTYKDKVIIGDAKIPCNMREMITPSAYLVENARLKINYVSHANKEDCYKAVMQYVHNAVRWTSDGRYDNYYYPAYTLQTKKGDCDDMAFVQCSIEPELGNAFGFYLHNPDQEPIGHSFAVGVVKDELIVFDSTGNKIVKYVHDKRGRYYIHFIVTKNQVWELDGSVEFGEVLWS